MSRLKVAASSVVAALCATAFLAATPVPAAAETAQPRNVLEWLFGSRNKAEQAPTSITPPQPARLSPTAKQSIDPKSRKSEAKSGKADAKPSLRKSGSAAKSPIDPVKQTAASGPYSGPFHGGGNNAYCVRSCDGFFFPINHEGAQGSDRYETACQTSCPGAETQVFFMKRGGDIKWSSNARGQGYMSLENALKYRKERDPACTCKGSQASWAAILKPLESTMKHAKTDIVITDDAQAVAAAPDAANPDKPGESRTVARAGDPAIAAMRATTFNDKITQPGKFSRIDPQPTGSVTDPKKADAPGAAERKPDAGKADPRKADAKRAETAKPKLDITPTGSIPNAPRADAKPKAAPIPATKVATAEADKQPAKAGSSFDKKKLNEAVSRLVTPYQRQQ